jgi:hypothetical protein
MTSADCFKAEKKNVILLIIPSNFSAYEKKDMTMKIKFTINMHAQILNKFRNMKEFPSLY